MKLKFVIVAVAMTFSSAAIAGSGCGYGHTKQVASCGEDTVWDAQSQSCVPLTTS